MSENLDKISDLLSSLTILEASELTKILEQKWGVSAAVAVAAPAAGEVAASSVEEKTEFDVILKSFGSNKIAAIKVARAITGLGLKEAKEVVDGLGTILEAVSKEAADEAKTKLEEAGAKVEIS